VGGSEVTTILRTTELMPRTFNEKNRIPTEFQGVFNLAKRISFSRQTLQAFRTPSRLFEGILRQRQHFVMSLKILKLSCLLQNKPTRLFRTKRVRQESSDMNSSFLVVNYKACSDSKEKGCAKKNQRAKFTVCKYSYAVSRQGMM